MHTQLEEAARTALNGLEVKDAEYKPYRHEILIYGVDAVSHHLLLRKAKENVSDDLSAERFCREQKLDFHQKEYGFLGPLEMLEQKGIFVPQQAKSVRLQKMSDRIWYFNDDYECRLRCGELLMRLGKIPGEDLSYAYELTSRKWLPRDLSSEEWIGKGLNFSKVLWKISAAGFEQSLEGWGIAHERQAKLPEGAANLARKLIKYYEEIISDNS